MLLEDIDMMQQEMRHLLQVKGPNPSFGHFCCKIGKSKASPVCGWTKRKGECNFTTILCLEQLRGQHGTVNKCFSWNITNYRTCNPIGSSILWRNLLHFVLHNFYLLCACLTNIGTEIKLQVHFNPTKQALNWS